MPESTKTRTAPPERFFPGGNGPASNEPLGKVREILFGAWQRENDDRFAAFENHVMRVLNEMRLESNQRLDALESSVRTDLQAMGERIKTEESQRAGAVESLHQNLKESGVSVGDRFTQIEDRMTRDEAAMRDQARFAHQELEQSLLRSIEQVRSAKLDHSRLAEVFSALTEQLRKDSPAGETGVSTTPTE